MKWGRGIKEDTCCDEPWVLHIEAHSFPTRRSSDLGWAKWVRGTKESTPEIIVALYANLDVNFKNFKINFLKVKKKNKPTGMLLNIAWGPWVAQSVKHPTSVQVMISRFMSSGPALGSVLTAQSLKPASDSVSPSLSLPHPTPTCALPLPHLCSVSLPSKINKC